MSREQQFSFINITNRVFIFKYNDFILEVIDTGVIPYFNLHSQKHYI
jgi:hypothetical protein